jgi:hypothetical protein
MHMIRGVLILTLLLLSSASWAQCRQALALGLDVSGSVDSAEYRLQMDGLAAALSHPEVTEALLAMPLAPVYLSIYEWSGPDNQHVLLGWTAIRDGVDLARVTNLLRTARRRDTSPGTALGTAMKTGAALLSQRSDCWKRTLDISGDGKHNIGPHPRSVKAELARHSLTINALVIGADAPGLGDLRHVEIGELSSYFRAYVISGPDAFVQTALGFNAYEQAMVRKLKRELEGLALSAR